MPPSKRVRRTANAADEPAGPPASAADAPTPAASSAASPPAPSTGEDTGSKEGKKESVAHWSPIELAVRALPPLCVVQCCTADTVLLICLSVHRPPLVRGSTRASGGVRVPRLTASTRRPSRTRTSSRRYAAPKEEATAGSALSTPSPSKSGHQATISPARDWRDTQRLRYLSGPGDSVPSRRLGLAWDWGLNAEAGGWDWGLSPWRTAGTGCHVGLSPGPKAAFKTRNRVKSALSLVIIACV